jgi:hypothetical protein
MIMLELWRPMRRTPSPLSATRFPLSPLISPPNNPLVNARPRPPHAPPVDELRTSALLCSTRQQAAQRNLSPASHRPASRVVCPSLDSPIDEQRGSTPPLIHQPTTPVVTAVAGAGAHEWRSTLIATVAGARAQGSSFRHRGRARRSSTPSAAGREGSSYRHRQAAREESPRLCLGFFYVAIVVYWCCNNVLDVLQSFVFIM